MPKYGKILDLLNNNSPIDSYDIDDGELVEYLLNKGPVIKPNKQQLPNSVFGIPVENDNSLESLFNYLKGAGQINPKTNDVEPNKFYSQYPNLGEAIYERGYDIPLISQNAEDIGYWDWDDGGQPFYQKYLGDEVLTHLDSVLGPEINPSEYYKGFPSDEKELFPWQTEGMPAYTSAQMFETGGVPRIGDSDYTIDNLRMQGMSEDAILDLLRRLSAKGYDI